MKFKFFNGTNPASLRSWDNSLYEFPGAALGKF